MADVPMLPHSSEPFWFERWGVSLGATLFNFRLQEAASGMLVDMFEAIHRVDSAIEKEGPKDVRLLSESEQSRQARVTLTRGFIEFLKSHLEAGESGSPSGAEDFETATYILDEAAERICDMVRWIGEHDEGSAKRAYGVALDVFGDKKWLDPYLELMDEGEG